MEGNPLRRKSVIAGIVILFLIVATVTFIKISHPSSSVAFTINEVPVTDEDFQMKMDDMRSQVFSYFVVKYGATDSKSFWTDSYSGEIPRVKLQNDVLEEWKKLRVIQISAQKKRIESFLDYGEFKKSLVQENARRKAAVKKNEPVYGPVQFWEKEYYSYVISNMIEELKKKLAMDELASTDTEEMNYYNNHKDQYELPDYIRINKITISTSGGDGKTDSILNQIETAVKQGKSLAQATKDFADPEGTKIAYEEKIFDEKTYRNDRIMYPNMLKMAHTMQVGQISDVVKETDSSLNIFQLVEKREGNYVPFESTKESLKKDLLEQKFNQWVSNQVKEARVVIYNKDLIGGDL